MTVAIGERNERTRCDQKRSVASPSFAQADTTLGAAIRADLLLGSAWRDSPIVPRWPKDSSFLLVVTGYGPNFTNASTRSCDVERPRRTRPAPPARAVWTTSSPQDRKCSGAAGSGSWIAESVPLPRSQPGTGHRAAEMRSLLHAVSQQQQARRTSFSFGVSHKAQRRYRCHRGVSGWCNPMIPQLPRVFFRILRELHPIGFPTLPEESEYGKQALLLGPPTD